MNICPHNYRYSGASADYGINSTTIRSITIINKLHSPGVQLMLFVMAGGSRNSKQQKSNMAAKFILNK
jgi:hypothetical protein